MAATVRVVRNQLPTQRQLLALAVAAAVETTAQDIATTVKQRSPSRPVAGTVTVRRRGALVRVVQVGRRRRGFYAGFLEYGARYRPATPFVTPAAGAARRQYQVAVGESLRRTLAQAR
jgi:HK97 gp10 family phage protein